jgi:hypothetical protein
MDHGVQIESLINYAKRNNSKPFYLLYNFTTTPLKTGVTLTNPIELTGCTLVSAEYLLKNHYNQRTNRNGDLSWIIPDFYDLNPNEAFPWHELVCPKNAKEFYDKLKNKGVINKNQVFQVEELVELNNYLKQGFYPLNTFNKDQRWVNVKELMVQPKEETKYHTDEPKILQSPKDYESKSLSGNSSEKERVYPNFSPKSRIILNK